MIMDVDPTLIGVVTLVGACLGLYAQILSLSSRVRERAAKEQKLLDELKQLTITMKDFKDHQIKIEAGIQILDRRIHELELSNQKQHEEMAVRITAIETVHRLTEKR